jgi:hypothetical protein
MTQSLERRMRNLERTDADKPRVVAITGRTEEEFQRLEAAMRADGRLREQDQIVRIRLFGKVDAGSAITVTSRTG